jgi:hypothetical protein
MNSLDGVNPGDPSTQESIARLGTAEVGRRYLAAVRSSASADKNSWIVDVVWFGRDENEVDLPVELRWSALDACPDDDGDLWVLGDGPFDELAALPGMVLGRPRRPFSGRLLLLYDENRPATPISLRPAAVSHVCCTHATFV